MKDWVMATKKLEGGPKLLRQRNHQVMICHTMMVVIMKNCLWRDKNIPRDISSPVLLIKVTTQRTGISVMGILEMLVILIIYGKCFIAHFVMHLTIVWLSVRNITRWSRKWIKSLGQDMRKLSQVWRIHFRWECISIFVPIVAWMGTILKSVGKSILNFVPRRT